MKYIYHHLGLGDHIICNGLIRSLIREDNEYTMFVKQHNLTSVEFMYRDLNNLKFICGDDSFVNKFLNEKKITKNELIVAGFYRHPNSKEFDDSFYLQNGIPFENRWEKFYVSRDVNREYDLFKKYDLIENEYVFIHDDVERNLLIDEKHIVNKKLKIIRPIKNLTNNIFDYCYIMEKSKELHFMDSSFRLLFDSLGVEKDLLFYHINYKNVLRDHTTKSQSKQKYIVI
jgi:hypothetical protein